MQHDAGVREGSPLPWRSGGDEQRGGADRLPHARRRDARTDVPHRVVDRQRRTGIPALAVDVELDTGLRAVRVEVQQLRDEGVRDPRIDAGSEIDDALASRCEYTSMMRSPRGCCAMTFGIV